MNNKERVSNLLNRKPIDYIPSQIVYTDMTRENAIAKALNLSKEQTLDNFLQNCMYLTFPEDDLPIFYRNDDDYMLDLEKKGFAYVDLENGIVYDRLGMGVKMHNDSFIVIYSPLEGNVEKDKIAAKHLPENITKLFGMPLEERIKKYTLPNGASEGCLDRMQSDYAQYDNGSKFLFPTGYFGVYERGYALIGWEQFMMEIAIRPNLIHELLEKVTEYKVQLAKERVKKIPSIIHHHGDDFGSQLTGLFSKKMFKEMIVPYLKRIFDVYTSAGCHICLHSCGYIMDYLPELIEIGVDMIEPVQTCNDLKTLKREFGKDLIFWGGIETQLLPFMSPEEVRKLTKEVMWTLGEGGGLIIGPSQHVQNDLSIENIVAMVETIMEERGKLVNTQ